MLAVRLAKELHSPLGALSECESCSAHEENDEPHCPNNY
jgi:hypothetical protein